MVGLYEIPIETLCTREVNGNAVPPKIVASTATANHATEQIRALYGRQSTATFPPAGIDALETYFSKLNTEDPGRLYLGVAAPGHPLKRILLRTYVSLLSAAQKAYADSEIDPALADAYMTLAGYFNSLRELGGMRRLVEDDVRYQCAHRNERAPVEMGKVPDWFTNREISEPLELTSRESTGHITESKNRLATRYADQSNTDVLLASNMISVGVDISRLGFMVVAGQPKTTSEYIQATSRVGRDRARPGIVVTCYNVARPRDRSHYEHFVAYHDSFYRFVEAQSVTPFASRALERGLTGALVASARFKVKELTRPKGAGEIVLMRATVDKLITEFVSRARRQPGDARIRDEGARRTEEWAKNRLDIWERLARSAVERATHRSYSRYDISNSGTPLLHHVLNPPDDVEVGQEKFSAPTSMRDVEPSVHLWLTQPGMRRKGSSDGPLFQIKGEPQSRAQTGRRGSPVADRGLIRGWLDDRPRPACSRRARTGRLVHVQRLDSIDEPRLRDRLGGALPARPRRSTLLPTTAGGRGSGAKSQARDSRSRVSCLVRLPGLSSSGSST